MHRKRAKPWTSSSFFQLQPSANVYDLARKFNLEVSLFERLVKVNFPFVCLKYQVRKSSKPLIHICVWVGLSLCYTPVCNSPLRAA